MKSKFFFIFLFIGCNFYVVHSLTKKEIKIITYKNQNKGATREEKLKIIDEINNEFADIGYSQDDEELIKVLLQIAGEGTLTKIRDYNTQTNDYSILRKSSIHLLSRFGGEVTRQGLLHILENEPNEMVLSEICNTLAIIGDNKNGDAFHRVVKKYHTIKHISSNLLLAIVNFTKEVTKNNPKMQEVAIYFLQKIIQTYCYGEYGYVRRRAKEMLKEIYLYSY